MPVIVAFASFLALITTSTAASKDVREKVLDIVREASDFLSISLSRTLANRLAAERGRLANGRTAFTCLGSIELMRLFYILIAVNRRL